MIDWTIHVSDVLTFGGVLGAACLYLARAVRHSYKHVLDQIEVHQEELEDHRGVLRQRGWHPDPMRGLSRPKKGAA